MGVGERERCRGEKSHAGETDVVLCLLPRVQLTILLLMFVEALVVAARQTNHFRVLRALRPIFLIDNHYLGGVRR